MAEIIIDEIERKNKRKGFYTSLFLHMILLVLALLPLLTFPTPPPGQEGILVNLGVQDVGQGEENAPPAKAPEPTPEPEETPPPPPEPEPEPEPTPPEPEPIPEPVVEETPPKEVLTDDNSKEIALQKEKERKKKEEERQKRLEDERRKREQQEADRKKRAVEEAKRKKAQEEARSKAEAAAEAKRKAEAEAKRRAEEAAVKDEIGGLFGGGSGPGKGNTGTSGNQGDPNGDPNSSILEGVSAGAGSSVGGGLRGRGILNSPKINDDFNKPGKVVVKVCVDASGKVISADFTQRGSTTTDSQLVRIAKKNARSYKFSRGGVDKQCGTITYVFKVK